MEKRGSGRTHRQLQRVPKEGAIFLVHNRAMMQHAQDIATKIHGPDHKIKMELIVDDWSLHKLRGTRAPIYCDHWLWDRSPQVIRDGMLEHRNFLPPETGTSAPVKKARKPMGRPKKVHASHSV